MDIKHFNKIFDTDFYIERETDDGLVSIEVSGGSSIRGTLVFNQDSFDRTGEGWTVQEQELCLDDCEIDIVLSDERLLQCNLDSIPAKYLDILNTEVCRIIERSANE